MENPTKALYRIKLYSDLKSNIAVTIATDKKRMDTI